MKFLEGKKNKSKMKNSLNGIPRKSDTAEEKLIGPVAIAKEFI